MLKPKEVRFGGAPNERERTSYLPRLSRKHYQGDAAVHWTLPISHFQEGWLTESFHSGFRELMLHAAAAREGLLCPAYCLMPDHLHLVWVGLRLDTDQLNGMAFLRAHLAPNLAPLRFSIRPTTTCYGRRSDIEARSRMRAITIWLTLSGLGWWRNPANGPILERSCLAIRPSIQPRRVTGGSSGRFIRKQNIPTWPIF